MGLDRVFITGASTGLGEGLARYYADKGATLGLVARREALLLEHKAAFEKRGATVHIYTRDVADTAAMQTAIDDFLQKAGGADLVIANAGVGIKDRIAEGEAAEIAWLFNINITGVTNTVVPFVPKMIEQGSGILCAVSSMAGHRALPRRTAYSTSKVAVRTFMDGMRMDLHGTGVHAMTLCPGFVTTPLTEDNPEMFFVIDVDKAVGYMTGAIAAKRDTFTFPWQMNIMKEVLKRSPEFIVRRSAPASRTKSSS